MNSNQIVVMGNLVRDPRVGRAGEIAVANFRIASSASLGRGNNKEVTYFNCTAWRAMADRVKDLTKGTSVIVVGRMRMTEWTDRDQQTRTDMDIVVEEIGLNIMHLDNRPARDDSDQQKADTHFYDDSTFGDNQW